LKHTFVVCDLLFLMAPASAPPQLARRTPIQKSQKEPKTNHNKNKFVRGEEEMDRDRKQGAQPGGGGYTKGVKLLANIVALLRTPA
jgi:hypothetical protein